MCGRYIVLLFQRYFQKCQNLDPGPGPCPDYSLASRREGRLLGGGCTGNLGLVRTQSWVPVGAWPHRTVWNFLEASRDAHIPQEAEKLLLPPPSHPPTSPVF